MHILTINRREGEQALTMELALSACLDVPIAVAGGKAEVPQRHQLQVPEQDGDMLVM